jgi:hypothetical protein
MKCNEMKCDNEMRFRRKSNKWDNKKRNEEVEQR